MILYTPLQQSEVFPENQENGNRRFISYEGRQVYAEQLENGTYELIQLYSTDPQDFLNANYSPGMIIPNKD